MNLHYDTLVGAYNLSRNTRSADRWTSLEWLVLHDAYVLSGWDFTPCQWAPWQVEDVLVYGLIPVWDDAERPVAPSRSRTREESLGTLSGLLSGQMPEANGPRPAPTS